jgi:hypothetical protein
LARADEAELVYRIMRAAFAEYDGKLAQPWGTMVKRLNDR